MIKKKMRLSVIIRAVSLILTFIVINVCFVFYVHNSTKHQLANAKLYIEGYSKQKINSINMILEEGLATTKGLAFFYSTELSTSSLTKERLQRILDNSDFTEAKYIDVKGQEFSSNGAVFDASKGKIFKDGMQENSGIVFDMKPDNRDGRRISFYAPIYYLNRLHGILVCSYNADRIADLLNGEICGFEGGCVILDDGMNVVVSSSNLPESLLNVSKSFPEYDLTGLTMMDDSFVDIYENPVPTKFDKTFHLVKRFVYIKKMDRMNWIFIQEFPEEALHGITTSFLLGSSIFMLEVITCLVLYMLGLAIYHGIKHIRTVKELKIRNYMVYGVSRIFSKFVLLDFETGMYQYLNTTPTDMMVEEHGPFEEIINYFLRIIIEEESKREFLEMFNEQRLRERLENEDRVFNYSMHVMNPNECWDTISVMAVEKKNGRVIKAIVTNQHVTELKRREERDRNALKDALVTAEEANKAKSNFLSNMSHDIRTPMNAIVGFATLIENDADKPDKVREYVEKVRASSEHLLGLINDVLDMSKIESGKVVLNEEVFAVEELRNALRDIIYPQMEKNKKIFTVTEHGLKYKYYRGDKLRIQQILINILSNAIKYTGEDGKISLDVYELSGTQNDNKYINLKYVVKDNGIGMDDEFLEHIFESFTRETGSTINKIQGTGLGMAITKSLVELMDGTITVKSKKGKGSTFEVVLPIKIADEQEIEAKEETDVNKDVLKGMKFFVVEDNEINYMVISSLLEMMGAESIHAENGEEAVNIFKKSCKDDFDMIFMDLQMPVMDGLAATRAIRNIDTPWAKEVPIIAMTANAYAEDVANALSAGMNAHVAKPIDINILIKTVNKLKK